MDDFDFIQVEELEPFDYEDLFNACKDFFNMEGES